MESRYNPTLVILSILVALFASYVALNLSQSVTQAKGRAQIAWLACGALALGVGMAAAIAGMHYIGMYSMGFPISGMHYTGMVAATLIHKEGPAIDGQNLLVSSGLAIAVIATTLLILGLALAGSVGQRIWTRRINRANDLIKSEARKAAILNASLEAIVTIDHTGCLLEWNLAAEKIFGFSSAEAIGRELAKLIIPERFRKSHREGLARYLTTGKGPVIGKRMEMTALRADGEEFPVELSICVIPDSDGPPVFTASARDITDRVHAAKALKKNEERFRQVIEATPNGLLMVDRSGKIVLCNSHFETLFGYGREEIVGREMEFLVPEKYRHGHPSHRAGFFQSPTTRQMGAGRDLYGLRKDGTEFPVEIGLNPLVTDEGTFVLASIVDITKRKALEDRIRHSANHIQQKNLEMEQFVYTVSHDLKSPLVTSSGFLGLLKEDIVAKRYDKIADSIGRLERANLRMNQLIDDLLQLSRAGRIKLEVEKIEVSLLVKAIVENLSAQIQEKSVVVSMLGDVPSVMGDRKRIYQVFENLIINAIKYGTEVPHPKITIGSEMTEGEIRFFVRDNGPGVAKEYHKKIFGLFQRLENDNRGTGVGLTIVSRIMQLHSGRVWVESDVGNGATFWLAFPKTFVIQGETEYE